MLQGIGQPVQHLHCCPGEGAANGNRQGVPAGFEPLFGLPAARQGIALLSQDARLEIAPSSLLGVPQGQCQHLEGCRVPAHAAQARANGQPLLGGFGGSSTAAEGVAGRPSCLAGLLPQPLQVESACQSTLHLSEAVGVAQLVVGLCGLPPGSGRFAQQTAGLSAAAQLRQHLDAARLLGAVGPQLQRPASRIGSVVIGMKAARLLS